MPETLTQPQLPALAERLPHSREELLDQLLPYDYDYAQQAGLIDMFYYNPKTGEDGLAHTFVGTVNEEGGEKMVQGFHHEPSGDLGTSKSSVDRTHLESLNSKKRASFKEFPLEPYNARVEVQGFKKYTITEDEDGHVEKRATKNSMFPKEYDALAVLQSIHNAYQGRDVSHDTDSIDDRGRPVKVAIGEAPLMDGENTMKIKLIMDDNPDPKQRKIYTAIPVVPQRPGTMRLTAEEADKLIYGNL